MNRPPGGPGAFSEGHLLGTRTPRQQPRGKGHEGVNILPRGARQNVDPFVTIPSGLLPRCPGTQKVALGEGPWAVQEAGSLDKGRVCYALHVPHFGWETWFKVDLP